MCVCEIPPPPFIILQTDSTERVDSAALCSAEVGNALSVELSVVVAHSLLRAFVSVAAGDSLRSRSGKTGAFL